MRIGLLATAAILLGNSVATAQPAEAPLPPIVFQTQPLGRVLDDIRAGANILGGDKGIKALNEGIKTLLGEKGFEGLDVGRPLVGYVVLAPKPEDITAVVAFPVTGEKEFLDLCDRANVDKLRQDAKDKTLYHMPPLNPRYKAVMRFQDRYAYIAYGFNPLPHLDPKALVPMAKLYDPAERGLVAARLHFDRIPLAVKLAAPALMEEVKSHLFGGGGPRGFGIGNQELAMLKPALAEIEKLAARYGKLAAGAETITARLLMDQLKASLVVEATLTAKPDTELAKTIAAFKPTTNKFGALIAHPDTVAGFQFRVPLLEEELRNAAAGALEAGRGEVQKLAKDDDKPLLEELFKGLIRTVKTGEFDVVGAVRGPDKAGFYTALGAIAFEDPSKLEKELRTYVEKTAPQDLVDAIKWDVAKAGTVNIHTWKMTPGGFLDVTKIFGGDDCKIAFAFSPQGVFGAIGPDAVATLKDALAVKPTAAPVLELVANSARIVKMVQKVQGPEDPDNQLPEEILGKEDKLKSVLSLSLEGGKQLKATFTIDLKVLPRLALYETFERVSGREKNVLPPDPIKK